MDDLNDITFNDSTFLTSQNFDTETLRNNPVSIVNKSKIIPEVPVDNLINLDQNLSSWGLPEAILAKYKERGIVKMFKWQLECLGNEKVLHGNCNLVYSAPTSAGKTLVAEILAIKTLIEKQKKVLVILPFVSVVREKMFYFQDIFSVSGIRVEGFMGSYTPAGGFKSVQLAICTIEKANSIINKLLENDSLNEIGAVVIDEMHLLGDPSRGYLLELLLTKLRYMSLRDENINIQLIGMSATLPNLNLLAKWLNAELYLTQFRPIPLYEFCMVSGEIYTNDFNLQRKLLKSPDLTEDTDNILQLCLETIETSCSVLIFCPTKNWCENLSQQISLAFYKLGRTQTKYGQCLRNQLNTGGILEILEQLKRCPVGLDGILKKTVSFGVAFHHAGLTMDERDIIEGAFRAGALRVLVATSTLSSGVNLPAQRVIIRTPMFHGKSLDTLTYRQMIGRAGRMGKDTSGESILICQKMDKRIATELMSANLQPIESCLEGAGKLKRAILEVIASGVATTPDEVQLFTNCTLLASDLDQAVNNPIVEAVQFLESNEFIRLQKDESGDLKYIATPLAKACLSSSLPPEEGLALFEEIEKARKCLVLDTELHLLYLVTPYSVCNQWSNLDWMLYLSIWEKLPSSMKRVADLVGVNESYIFNATQGRINTSTTKLYHKLQIHRRFYTALALQDLVNEIQLNEVAAKFQCNRGMLQSLQQSASMFAGMVTSFCHQLKWNCIEILIAQFQDRLQFGIHHELLDLMKLPTLNGPRARSLYNAGIESLTDLASYDVCKLENLLHSSVPFQSDKEREGETADDVEQKKKIKAIWITGKQGLTAREAASLLIKDARKYLQYEVGAAVMKWDEDNSDYSTASCSTDFETSSDSILSHNNNRNIHKSKIFIPKLNKSTNIRENSVENYEKSSISSVLKKKKKKSDSKKIQEKTINNLENSCINKNPCTFRKKEIKSVLKNSQENLIEDNNYKNLDTNVQLKKIQNPLPINNQQNSLPTIKSARKNLQKSQKLPETTPINNQQNSVDLNFSKTENLSSDLSSIKVKTPVVTYQKKIQPPLITKQFLLSPNLKSKQTDLNFGTPVAASENQLNLDLSTKSPQLFDDFISPVSSLPSTFQPKINTTEPAEDSREILMNTVGNFENTCYDIDLNQTDFNSSIDENEQEQQGEISLLDLNQINFDTQFEISGNQNETSHKENHSKIEDIFTVSTLENLNDSNWTPVQQNEEILNGENTKNITCESNQSLFEDSLNLDSKFYDSLNSSIFDQKIQDTSDIIDTSDLEQKNSSFSLNSISNSIRKIRKNTPRKRKNSLTASTSCESPQKKQKIILHENRLEKSYMQQFKEDTNLDLSSIDIIDVCNSRKLFECFCKEFEDISAISMSIACELYEQDMPIIGCKIQPVLNITDKFIYNDKLITGVAVSSGDNTVYYVSFTNVNYVKNREKITFFKKLLNNKIVKMFDYKEQSKLLYNACKILINCKAEDPKIADWILEPEGKEKNLQAMALKYSPEAVGIAQLSGNCKGIGSVGLDVNSSILSHIRASIEALVTWHVIDAQKDVLIAQTFQLLDTFQIEMQSLCCLTQMEIVGFGVNKNEMNRVVTVVQEQMAILQQQAFSLAGRRFSFTSSKDVAKVIGIYKGKRISTNKQSLEQSTHPISNLILQWRKLSCTLTKMLFPIIRSLKNDRIHGGCVTHTATGRISMHEPNLQSIVRNYEIIKSDGTRVPLSVRSCFIPSPGKIFLSADYCQLELRLLAHLSQDPTLCNIMRSDQDVFKLIASKLNHIEESEVTEILRQQAKQLCYGNIYGMGIKALSVQFGSSEEEAVQFQESFRKTYPKINEFIQKIIRNCQDLGYVETLAGRRRYLPLINDENITIKSQAERQAVNTTIQGSAADIAKNAMVSICNELNQKFQPFQVSLVLHLHDELLYEVPTHDLQTVAHIVKTQMENSVHLSIPFPVKLKTGPSWGELKDFQVQ